MTLQLRERALARIFHFRPPVILTPGHLWSQHGDQGPFKAERSLHRQQHGHNAVMRPLLQLCKASALRIHRSGGPAGPWERRASDPPQYPASNYGPRLQRLRLRARRPGGGEICARRGIPFCWTPHRRPDTIPWTLKRFSSPPWLYRDIRDCWVPPVSALCCCGTAWPSS